VILRVKDEHPIRLDELRRRLIQRPDQPQRLVGDLSLIFHCLLLSQLLLRDLVQSDQKQLTGVQIPDSESRAGGEYGKLMLSRRMVSGCQAKIELEVMLDLGLLYR